jgi:hypothetical protein
MATADFRNIDAVLLQFDVMNTPYIEVYEGKQKKFEFIENDLDGAKEFIAQQLAAIKYFGNTALFKIAFYHRLTDKDKFAIDNLKGSNTFKLQDYAEAMETPYWQGKQLINGKSSNSELAEIKELLTAQQSQINSLLEPSDDEAENQPVGGIMGALQPILQNPDIQQAIASRIIGLIDTLIPNKMNTQQQQQVTLGALTQDQADSINVSIERLINAGMTESDFAKLATMAEDKTKASFLLGMLRNN